MNIVKMDKIVTASALLLGIIINILMFIMLATDDVVLSVSHPLLYTMITVAAWLYIFGGVALLLEIFYLSYRAVRVHRYGKQLYAIYALAAIAIGVLFYVINFSAS